MAIVWNEALATGEERIDRQHQMLFEFVNKLELQLQQEHMDESIVRSVIQFLSSYTKTHFVYEELCMHRLQCAVAQQNQTAHDQFLALFKEAQTRFGREGASRALVEYIYNAAAQWLVRHIANIDTNLRQYIHT